jgi:glycosyltransferase involved in cell wall biosynthesis
MNSVTLIICTYNRCRVLANALENIAASRMPASVDWDVLVVDNNSSDDTRHVVENISQRHPGRFRYLFEPRPGKSNALNLGIRQSRGDILAFTDDDVVIPPDWLQNVTAPLRSGEWGGVGGKILPQWPCPPPVWLPRRKRDALAPLIYFDYGDGPAELTTSPFGANMAYRKELFEKYGGFRTDLGISPSSYVGNEDSELGNRLLAAGVRFCYEPSALLYHPVTPNRLKKDYFLEWHYTKAQGSIRQFGILPGTKYFICGVPLYLVRRLIMWTLRWHLAIKPSPRFESKCIVWGLCGQIKECYLHPLSSREPTPHAKPAPDRHPAV